MTTTCHISVGTRWHCRMALFALPLTTILSMSKYLRGSQQERSITAPPLPPARSSSDAVKEQAPTTFACSKRAISTHDDASLTTGGGVIRQLQRVNLVVVVMSVLSLLLLSPSNVENVNNSSFEVLRCGGDVKNEERRVFGFQIPFLVRKS